MQYSDNAADFALRAELEEQKLKEAVNFKRMMFQEHQRRFKDLFDFDECIIRFRKLYNADGKVFTYVAIYIQDTKLWYLSGRHTAGLTTEDLILWMVSGDFPVAAHDVVGIEMPF